MTTPTFDDILAAGRRLGDRLPRTPATSYPRLAALSGAGEVWLKNEGAQPIGAFKVRGGLNLLAAAEPASLSNGVVGYSTGNHAQSLAFAAREFGVACTIVMPVGPNPTKAAAVLELGAELIEHGSGMSEAGAYAESLAAERGARLVSAGDEPDLVAGVGTAYTELLAQMPAPDALLVPVGSGTGAAAACLVAAALAPDCEVIAVQSATSPAAHDSWRAGEIVQRSDATRVEGLATGTGFAMPQRILRERLTDFLLVDDDAIAAAQWQLLTKARTLTEGAGAAPLAGLLSEPTRFEGRRVALMCSGANASEQELRRVAEMS